MKIICRGCGHYKSSHTPYGCQAYGCGCYATTDISEPKFAITTSSDQFKLDSTKHEE